MLSARQPATAEAAWDEACPYVRLCTACHLPDRYRVAGGRSREPTQWNDDRPLHDLGLSSGVVRDGNGDGLADMVAARIVMPAAATVREIQGASNIAARLGFETTAFTIPLVGRDGEQPPAGALPILIGRNNAVVKRLERAERSTCRD